MRNKLFFVRFIFLAVVLNLFAAVTVFSENVEFSIKKAVLLSKVVKLGDILGVELELEKTTDGKYPVKLYLKDADGKSVVGLLAQDLNLVKGKVNYDLKFEIPKNIPVSSFYQDDAQPYRVYIRIGESEEREIGTISLYRKSQRVRDGIIVLPGFRVPFYVILMSFLGAVGYVLTSIFTQPEFTKRNICKWIYRLFLGPLLSVFLYSISTLINSSPDAYIIGALCFASGFYISPIQAKMRNLVYDKLAPDKKIEDDIAELKSDETELITRLLISKRAAYFLKKEGIVTVADLSAASDEKLKSLAASSGIDENYLLNKKAAAKSLDDENISKLQMPLELIKKMPKSVRYMRDIVSLDTSKIRLSQEEQYLLNGFMGMAKKTLKIDDKLE